MKRTTIAIFLSVFIWTLTATPLSAGEYDEFVQVIKGEVVDENGDGIFESFSFIVKSKNANYDFPVLDVRLGDSMTGDELEFVRSDINKKFSEYTISLEGRDLSDVFDISITLDISVIVNGDDISAGGPGSKPNETVILLKFP